MKTILDTLTAYASSPQSALIAGVCGALLGGFVLSAEAKVSITVKDGVRVIESDGMPDHPTGKFPNEGNPNKISAQKHNFRVPAEPKPAETTTALGMWPFGVAVDGVPFDPFAAEWWKRNPRSGWQYEPMFGKVLGIDKYNAHVQPDGSYHYHGLPTYLIENGDKTKPVLIGYAADGFPIYGPSGYKTANDAKSELVELKSSYRMKEGERPNGPRGKYDGHFVQDYEFVPGLGDLDECNGRTGVTPEYPNGTYYYVLTDSYPFIPRVFRGTPDPSFLRRPPPGGFRGGPGGMRGPRGMMSGLDDDGPPAPMGGERGDRGRRMGPPPRGGAGFPPPGPSDESELGAGQKAFASNSQQAPGERRFPPPLMHDEPGGNDMGPPPSNGTKQSKSAAKQNKAKAADRAGRSAKQLRLPLPPPDDDQDADGSDSGFAPGHRPGPPPVDGENVPPGPPGEELMQAAFGDETGPPPPPMEEGDQPRPPHKRPGKAPKAIQSTEDSNY